MNPFRLLLIFSALCTSIFSQTDNDTIFRTNGKIIVCTITHTTSTVLSYKVKDNDITSISMSYVTRFTQKGKASTSSEIQQNHPSVFKVNNNSMTDSVHISNEINYMRTCLRNFHNEYKIGGLTFLFGLGINLTGISIAISSEGEQSNAALAISAVGGVVSLVGLGIMFDSHKWINRAGLGVTGNGLTVRYIIK